MNKLVRGLSLRQAVSINMIDMVGIGPFITLSLIIGSMNGPQCILAWILGAILSFCDGCVWSELGAKWPQAGGSYVFLQHLYGKEKFGRLFSFLYIWQTSIQAPLVIASGAIGFAQYLTYLVPLSPLLQQFVPAILIMLLVFLLYREITHIGKISVFMWIVVSGTILWLIFSGATHFDAKLAFTYPKNAFDFTPLFFLGLGQATTKTIYCFLGYYNVCHLGGEIKDPEINIPRSIFISIIGITLLYLLMQLVVLGVIPWQQAKDSKFIVSTFFEKIYGTTGGKIATGLILFIAISSLFSVMLGYSRVLYAAAVDGNFFKIFSRLHPVKNFPHVSLLMLGGVAIFFTLKFKIREIIPAIVIMRILIQFVSQGIGIILLHSREKKTSFPFRMFLFPIPALIGLAVWMFIFYSSETKFKWFAIEIILSGIVLFVLFSLSQRKWPFKR